MLMNGSWHIYRPGESWKRPMRDMRVLIGTQDFVAVAFNIQVADFYAAASMDKESPSRKIKQDFLAAGFDEQDAFTRLRSADPQMQVGEALLRQSIVAGIGNVYKSEVAFACRVHPFAVMSMVSNDQLRCMLRTARTFMQANVRDTSGEAIISYTGFRRTTGRANPSDRLWVYGRAGKPCRKCGTPIRSRKQGVDARTTFWCPNCQKLPGEG
jgi:endonuclease-8